MQGTIFESRDGSFDSLDFSFRQVGWVELDRIALEMESTPIPGSDPLFFQPQQGERSFSLSYVYRGRDYHNDLTKFANKLYHSRLPLRIILAEEDDRFYVAQVVQLPTKGQHRQLGTVEISVQLHRNYAFRRWRDDEIHPDNRDIHFQMPIVPVRTEYDLTGSTAVIPYFNEGMDLSPVLELNGVDYPTVLAGDSTAMYKGRSRRKIQLDFNTLKARENGTDQSVLLTGDQVVIPHGYQLLRLHYHKPDEVVKKIIHDTENDFRAGEMQNLRIGGDTETGGAVESRIRAAPAFLRPSDGYHDDGTEVGPDQPRLTEGRFRQAIRIEEAVTQHLSHADWNSLSTWVTSAGISPTGNNQGVARTLQASADAGKSRVWLYQSVAAAPGETITLQTFLRKAGAVDYAELRLSFYDSSQTFISNSAVTNDVTSQLSDEFDSYSVTAVAPANTASVRAYVLYDGGTQRQNCEYEAVMPMLTKTPHVWGWHRDGTKAAETLTVENTGLFHNGEGSIGVWAYEDGSNRRGCLWQLTPPGSGLQLNRRDNGTMNVETTDGLLFEILTPEAGWHYWEVRWQNHTMEVYLDGEIAQQTDGTDARLTNHPLDLETADQFQIGHRDGLLQWNHKINSVKITTAAPLPYDIQREPKADGITSYLLLPNREMTPKSGGEYTSASLDISTDRTIRHGQLDFEQSAGGSVIFESSLFLGGEWTMFEPVAYDGTLPGIGPDTDLTGARLRYRVRFQTYDATKLHRLYQVGLTLTSEREGKLIIKNRKRLI
ncbi:hypothetical protein [Desmospora profundinema]|uniref:LamG domain-containing protein n=1 Tax=Desmospora profundinema TaxID=1571184 RepID=A0ABU1IM14_9BACL|nr:hypothetical protein [Desmospora profundinema]MDR6225453.1 hypothetical protein [Desmospora profundinema]